MFSRKTLLLIPAAFLVLAGCSKKEEPLQNVAPQTSIDDQVRNVQNSSTIPPQAKAGIIAKLRNGGASDGAAPTR